MVMPIVPVVPFVKHVDIRRPNDAPPDETIIYFEVTCRNPAGL